MTANPLRCGIAILIPAVTMCLYNAAAQAPANLLSALGAPPHVNTWPVPGGFVNLDNGNLHLEIPLQTIKERNGQSTSKLIYDSTFWYGEVQYIGATRTQELYATPNAASQVQIVL